jgi:hypothetical protein
MDRFMINDFLVQAFPERNELKITLDGYFMSSELELALYLAKTESEKLIPGYLILMDIKNLKTGVKKPDMSFKNLQRRLKMIGGGSLRIKGMRYRSNKW